MRHYINQTSKPMSYRIWTLKCDSITNESGAFLASLDIKVRVTPAIQEIEHHGKLWQFRGHAKIEIETTCKEQETMLQLKYGDDLILIEEFTVLPNSMMST